MKKVRGTKKTKVGAAAAKKVFFKFFYSLFPWRLFYDEIIYDIIAEKVKGYILEVFIFGFKNLVCFHSNEFWFLKTNNFLIVFLVLN